jgi:hypothetical protein
MVAPDYIEKRAIDRRKVTCPGPAAGSGLFAAGVAGYASL